MLKDSHRANFGGRQTSLSSPKVPSHVILNLFQDLINRRVGKALAFLQKIHDSRHCGLDPQSHNCRHLHVFMGKNPCHPEKVKKLIEQSEIRFLPCSGSLNRTPTPNPSPLERVRTAFTLAEVLITLGIIGVVAAMTLPALVGNYRKVEASSRLKKFVSSMEQAIRFSEAVNGDSKEWSKADSQLDNEGNIDYEAQGKVSKEFFMTYLAPYFKYTKIVDGKNTVDENGNKSGTETTVYLADGSSFFFNNGGCMDILFDVNGVQKPNKTGKDRYVFVMCFSKANRLYFCGSDKKAFCTYGTNRSGANNTREKALADCTISGFWCSSLLEMDGWEFKEDYPYKL